MFDNEIISLNIDQEADAFLRSELSKATQSDRRVLIEKVILAALGSIPWVGGFLSATLAFKSEEGSRRSDALHTQWLEEHANKLRNLHNTLQQIVSRFESLGPSIDERIQSPEYLQLVRRAFRIWDDASTQQKRDYVRNVLVNSAGTRICSDDVIRLFLDWLNIYHESHFAIIQQVYHSQAFSRNYAV